MGDLRKQERQRVNGKYHWTSFPLQVAGTFPSCFTMGILWKKINGKYCRIGYTNMIWKIILGLSCYTNYQCQVLAYQFKQMYVWKSFLKFALYQKSKSPFNSKEISYKRCKPDPLFMPLHKNVQLVQSKLIWLLFLLNLA